MHFHPKRKRDYGSFPNMLEGIIPMVKYRDLSNQYFPAVAMTFTCDSEKIIPRIYILKKNLFIEQNPFVEFTKNFIGLTKFFG